MYADKSGDGLFSQLTVRNSDSEKLYNKRVTRSSNLFSEDEPEEDDTKVDDLTFAAEMISYDKPTMKTWKTRKTDNLFTDTKAEEEARITSLLLEDTEQVVLEEKKNASEFKSTPTSSKHKNKTKEEISVSDISQQVDDLLQKFGPSETNDFESKPVELTQDFDVSAYISANQSKPKGLFD